MNFDFETSRVDCISKKNITLILVYEKITPQSLETPSHSPTIFSKKNIKGFCCIVVVVALLFYVHGKHLRSCRDGQLT